MAKKKKKVTIKSVLQGSVLASPSVIKQLPFVVFLALMGGVSVTMHYTMDNIISDSVVVKNNIKGLRASSIAYEAQVMEVNRPSTIAEKVEERGLEIKEPTEPPYKLIVKKIEDE